MKPFNSDKVRLWLCTECGSPSAEVRVWVNANTDEYTGAYDDDGDCYCAICDGESRLDSFEVLGDSTGEAIEHASRWSTAVAESEVR